MTSASDDSVCLCLASVPSEPPHPCVCRTEEFGGQLLSFARTTDGTIDFVRDDPRQRTCECELGLDGPTTVPCIWEGIIHSPNVIRTCAKCRAVFSSLNPLWMALDPLNKFVDAWCRNKRGHNPMTVMQRKVLRGLLASSITGKKECGFNINWSDVRSSDQAQAPPEMLHFPIIIQRLAKHGWFVDGCVLAAQLGASSVKSFDELLENRDARKRLWRLWSVDQEARWMTGRFVSKRLRVHDNLLHGWNCISTLMFALTQPTGSPPLEKFVNADGDHAVCARVLKFLIS